MRFALKRGRRMALGLVAFAGAALVSACLKSTEPQASLIDLMGTWKYTGVQTGPFREDLIGTLTVTSESGTSFQGQLNLFGQNPQTGETRPLNGPVSGSAVGIDVIDLDADIEASLRRHVGRIVVDTITGTWAVPPSGGPMVSGTFKLERESR